MSEDSSATEDLIHQAAQVARAAHAGQVDKLGVDYFEHVAAVADAVSDYGANYQIVALLHDSLEDCDDRSIVSPELLARTFGAAVAQAIDAITKRTGEDYERDYLQRVLANPIARVVKRADVAHNRSRLHHLAEDTRARLAAKYDRFDALAARSP